MMAKKRNRFQSNSDFTEANLPHTRPQVFKSVYRTRFFYILKVSLLLTAFCLPLFIWQIFMQFKIDDIALSLAEDMSNSSEILSETLWNVIFKNLVALPFFALCGLGFGGAIHAFQKLVWNQISFASDFFEGFKKSFLRYLACGILFGLSFFLLEFTIYALPLTDFDFIIRAICYGLSIVQICFFAIFIAFIYLQYEYYSLKFFNAISNAFKLMIKSFFPCLLFILIIAIPYFLMFIKVRMLYFALIFVFLFVSSPGLISLILYIDFKFDVLINRSSFPEIVDRGVFRERNYMHEK